MNWFRNILIGILVIFIAWFCKENLEQYGIYHNRIHLFLTGFNIVEALFFITFWNQR